MNMRALIQRHSVAAYFFLAFCISWGGSLAILSPKFARGEVYQPTDTVLTLLAMLAGPSLAGISPANETLWYTIYAAVLWVVAAVVIAKYGENLEISGREIERRQ